jgi:hypothetical protein
MGHRQSAGLAVQVTVRLPLFPWTLQPSTNGHAAEHGRVWTTRPQTAKGPEQCIVYNHDAILPRSLIQLQRTSRPACLVRRTVCKLASSISRQFLKYRISILGRPKWDRSACMMLRRACQRLPSLLQQSAAYNHVRRVKDSTYLAGLDVDTEAEPHTRQALKGLMEKVKSAIPDGVEYRRHVESYCTRFMKVIDESPSQPEAEKVLGRQYEEIQQDVIAELAVLESMAQWKPWEVPEGHVPRLFADMKDIPSNVRGFREFQHEMGTSERGSNHES